MNLRISGFRWSKIIQEKYKKGYGIPKVFGLISLFASVAMSDTKSIIPEIASFVAKLIHHEEWSKSYLDNLSNFTNPLVSKIEEENDTFYFKEVTSQPDRLDFVGGIRKEMGAY